MRGVHPTPGYFDLPAGTLAASSLRPVTLTIAPGACVGRALGTCPPTAAVIAHGSAATTEFTVLAARRPAPK